MATDPELLRLANESGFPLQVAIEHVVRQTSAAHGWKVRHTEHAWRNPADGQSGFIDLVLGDANGFAHAVVECKRVRNATWLFFSGTGSLDRRYHCRAWATHYRNGSFNAFGWFEVSIDPATPEANFCAVRGQSTNDRNTLLERVAGELISSTEALALGERDYRRQDAESLRLYFNVIVTTATLKFAEFNTAHLSIADGTITEASFSEVPFIRMRKQFSMRPAHLTPDDWLRHDDPDYRRENTVFVVNANHLGEFLGAIEVANASLRQFGV